MKILCKYIWLWALCGFFTLVNFAHSQTILVDGSQTNQLIEGFGANLNYQGWTNNDLKPVIDALVDQANMTLFRVVFDNADWEGTNDNGDSTVMNWSYYNTVYSSPQFEQLWGLLGYLNQKGISNGIVLNFQGHGPAWMGGNGLTPGYEDEWAEMIASLLYYARNNRNLQFNLVAPDNEPDNAPQGITVGSPAQYVTMLHDLAVKLDTNGMSDVRFVAPDLAFTDTNWMAAIMDDPVVMAKVAHFGLHSYTSGGVDSAGIANFIQQSPYPDRTFWMTEFNVWCPQCEAGQYGLYDWAYCEGTAQFLLSHLANGASAGMVWEGYDAVYYILGQRWSLWGLLGVDDTNAVPKTYTPRKHFYTLSQISKFVRPGAYSIGVASNDVPFAQLLAFWQPSSGQFTLTGVNTDTGPDPLTVNLASLPALQSLELYYTDDTSNLVHLATVPVSGGTNFTANIPADCIFTLVGNAAISATITNPAEGAQFNAPANVSLQAAVSTAAATISGVDFYNGTTNIGTDTTPPYSMVWSNVGPGSYFLTAHASNSVGNSVVSPAVHIVVAGPLAQITILPTNATLAPSATQQFFATGRDAAGLTLNPQPAFAWSASSGTIDTNGLFTPGGTAASPVTITASNSLITGSASVTILTNLAPSGTAYTWYGMTGSSQNSPRAAAPGINDGDLAADVPLRPGGFEELSSAWEAAGVVWGSPQFINRVTYINGSMNQYNDGVFAAGFKLQFSPDGTTWTNAGPEWSVTPAYTYNSAASADVSFNFTGGQVSALGVRCVGRVHTVQNSQNSWVAFATELQAYPAPPPPPSLQTAPSGSDIIISWDGSVTNYVLEATTNGAPPFGWTPVTNTPQPAGNQQQVIITPGNQLQLFRLHQH